MTEFEHLIVGLTLLGIVWHLFLRKYFLNPKDVEAWEDYLREKFF